MWFYRSLIQVVSYSIVFSHRSWKSRHSRMAYFYGTGSTKLCVCARALYVLVAHVDAALASRCMVQRLENTVCGLIIMAVRIIL